MHKVDARYPSGFIGSCVVIRIALATWHFCSFIFFSFLLSTVPKKTKVGSLQFCRRVCMGYVSSVLGGTFFLSGSLSVFLRIDALDKSCLYVVQRRKYATKTTFVFSRLKTWSLLCFYTGGKLSKWIKKTLKISCVWSKLRLRVFKASL